MDPEYIFVSTGLETHNNIEEGEEDLEELFPTRLEKNYLLDPFDGFRLNLPEQLEEVGEAWKFTEHSYVYSLFSS